MGGLGGGDYGHDGAGEHDWEDGWRCSLVSYYSFEPRESGNLSRDPWMPLADGIWGWRSYGGSRLVSWIAETLVVLVSL